MLCLTLIGNTMDQNLNDYNMYDNLFDLAELRVDCLTDLNESELTKASQFPSLVSKPVILTCRRKQDGGFFFNSETQRLSVIKQIACGNFTYVDLESETTLDELADTLKNDGKKIIRSVHNFGEISSDLFDFAKKTSENKDIPKIAVQIKSTNDLKTIYLLSQKLNSIKNKIIVGMGNFGVPSRILYRKFGSMLTYCITKDGQNSMQSISKMKELYQADSIDDNTPVYGIAGLPAMHSMSPVIHNKGFKAIGQKAVYIPFETDNLNSLFELVPYFNIKGLSITAPYKTEVIRFLNKWSDNVTQTKACNTVLFKDKDVCGENTDFLALKNLFKDKNISNVLLIGSGAVARIIATYFVLQKATLVIVNRTVSKARMLAKELNCNYDSLENAKKYSKDASLIVQATSTDLNIDIELKQNQIAMELVYNPADTHFVQRTKNSGCSVIYGLDFLLEQAKFQFKLYSGKNYPLQVNPLP